MVRVVYMGTLDCCRSSPTSMVQNWARVSTSLGRKVPSLSPVGKGAAGGRRRQGKGEKCRRRQQRGEDPF